MSARVTSAELMRHVNVVLIKRIRMRQVEDVGRHLTQSDLGDQWEL